MNDSDIKPLADAIYIDRVRRALRLTEGQRIDTSIELFEGALGMMRDGIRAQHLVLDASGVEDLLRKRLRRLRQVADHGIYRPA